MWRGIAESANRLIKKGELVYIEGLKPGHS